MYILNNPPSVFHQNFEKNMYVVSILLSFLSKFPKICQYMYQISYPMFLLKFPEICIKYPPLIFLQNFQKYILN